MQGIAEVYFLSVNNLYTLQQETNVRHLHLCLLYLPVSIHYLFLWLQKERNKCPVLRILFTPHTGK